MNKRVFLIFNFLLLILVILLTRNAGLFLLISDSKLSNKNLVLVLMGSSEGDRELVSYSLFKTKHLSRIIFVNNIPGIDIIPDSLGIHNFLFTNPFLLNIKKLGIPDSLITILPGQAKSTRDEAKYAMNYLCKDSSINHITIITSSYHTRRAYMIFKKQAAQLNCTIDIDMAPNPYTKFKARGWWKDRESSKIVFSEWIKLIHFVCWEQFFENR